MFHKKNLLDLEYQKNLQYLNTSIIILFTYAIGVVLAFVTGQVDATDSRQFALIIVLSSAVTTILFIKILRFTEILSSVPHRMARLRF
jgi:hypothetical protein